MAASQTPWLWLWVDLALTCPHPVNDLQIISALEVTFSTGGGGGICWSLYGVILLGQMPFSLSFCRFHAPQYLLRRCAVPLTWKTLSLSLVYYSQWQTLCPSGPEFYGFASLKNFFSAYVWEKCLPSWLHSLWLLSLHELSLVWLTPGIGLGRDRVDS